MERGTGLCIRELASATPLLDAFLRYVPEDYFVTCWSGGQFFWIYQWVKKAGLEHENLEPRHPERMPKERFWSTYEFFFLRFRYNGDWIYALEWPGGDMESWSAFASYLAAPSCEIAMQVMKEAERYRRSRSKLHIYGLTEDERDWTRQEWRRSLERGLTWDQFFMPADRKKQLWQSAWVVFDHPELFTSQGIPPKRGLLFVGPPGNGKTTFIRIMVREFWRRFPDGHVVVIYRADPLSSMEDTFTAALNKVSELSRDGLPTIFIMEDLDCLTGDESLRAVILNTLDGLLTNSLISAPSLFIATTNRPERIDPSLHNRPSRFDTVFVFDPPSLEMRKQYLASLLREDDVTEDDIQRVAGRTHGLSYAFLKEIVIQARYIAVYDGREKVTKEDLQSAAENAMRHFRWSQSSFRIPEDVGFGRYEEG